MNILNINKGNARNPQSELKRQRIKSLKSNVSGLILRFLVKGSALITLGVIVLIISYILIKGIPNVKLSLFDWEYNTNNVSMMPAIVNTLLLVLATLIIALPIGIGAAIYLNEYISETHIVGKTIRLATETLAGIPSIVYGLFGALFFVKYLHLQLSLISGALTLALMILPMVMGTTGEALKMVPKSYKEGSLALGAGRVRTIFKVVLPPATPGILAGLIIAIGRIIGESAALIFTAGTIAKPIGSLLSPGRTLSVHMYVLSGEGLFIDQTYATATILLLIVLGINGVSSWVGKKFGDSAKG